LIRYETLGDLYTSIGKPPKFETTRTTGDVAGKKALDENANPYEEVKRMDQDEDENPYQELNWPATEKSVAPSAAKKSKFKSFASKFIPGRSKSKAKGVNKKGEKSKASDGASSDSYWRNPEDEDLYMHLDEAERRPFPSSPLAQAGDLPAIPLSRQPALSPSTRKKAFARAKAAARRAENGKKLVALPEEEETVVYEDDPFDEHLI